MASDTPKPIENTKFQVLNRRGVLQSLAGLSGALALSSLSCKTQAPPQEPSQPTVMPKKEKGLPVGLDEDNFISHNLSPLALETLRSKMGSSVITPNSRFFIRNNLPRPNPSIVKNAEAWVLSVLGTNKKGQISLAELKKLGLDTVTTVLQCSGNGRFFFNHGASGSQWATGAAACAVWTGVRVSTVLDYFGGATSEGLFLTSTGGEELPLGVEREKVVVERSIPIEKGIKDCLLAWEMNGEPLPLTHGGPLRLIVPGYYGCNNIKYVKLMAVTPEQSPAKIQSKGYRMRAIGEKGAPEHPSMWRMPIKSWVNGPGSDGEIVRPGSVIFHGVAFSGERGVSRVEVSMDNGENWNDAVLHGPDLGPNAWRQFIYRTNLVSGTHKIVSRAYDSLGEAQPKDKVLNERGYGHNGWFDHKLEILVDSEGAPRALEDADSPIEVHATENSSPLSESAERGRAIFKEESDPACGLCHSLENAEATGAIGPNLDDLKPSLSQVEQALNNGVGAMPSYADNLTPKEVGDLAAYISEVTKP